MESPTILHKKKLPVTFSPYHHRNLANDVNKVNEVINTAGLDDETKAELVQSIERIAHSCVQDAIEKHSSTNLR